MESILWLAWVLMFLFAGASFVFSAAETAMFSLGRWQVRHLSEAFPRRGGIVSRLLAQPQDLLATLVLGNTTAFAAMLGIAVWMIQAGVWSLGKAFAGVLLLMVFGCELLPKTLAVRRPDIWSLRVAPILIGVHRGAVPLRWVSQGINRALLRGLIPRGVEPQLQLSEGEYQELLELAEQQGTLQQSEKEIILQIMNLDRQTAGDVMRHRSQMACIPDDLSVDEMLAAARKFRHRRLPMYDETADTIVGVLNTRVLLLDPTVDLADAIEFPSFVPESMNLLQLLRSLQRQQRGMAIVLDEFGGTAGIVTLEDILEEVVGRARGEPESEGIQIEQLGKGRWRVHGSARLDDFVREYPPLGEVEDVETLGGLLVQLLEVVPAQGESATFRGLRLTATVTDGRRVRELLVERVK